MDIFTNQSARFCTNAVINYFNTLKTKIESLKTFSRTNKILITSFHNFKNVDKCFMLRVVTIAMICFALLHSENFNISGGLYIAQLNIYDGAFIAKIVSLKYIYKKKLHCRYSPGF